MVDETPIPVLEKDHPGSTHRGYYWVHYYPINKIVCFDYQRGRGQEGPIRFLKGYRGTLQTDGYSGYDIFDHKEGITMLSWRIPGGILNNRKTMIKFERNMYFLKCRNYMK